MTKHLFPILIILLYLGAAISYGIAGDWKRSLYWVFAIGLVIVTMF